MSLFRIAWRSIQRRGLASLLTCLSMALGVTLVVAVLLIMGIVSESFRNNSSLGYNMIVGARGGKLQMVLNTVYHLSSPVENLPYRYYQEFLSAEQRQDGRDGQFAPLVKFAIPVCMGDFLKNYRVVGTSPRMFDDFVYDTERERRYEFAAGRNFETFNSTNGFFEAVVGATVARELHMNVGESFAPSHGDPDGTRHDTFTVVGVLRPTGTPNDRAVFVNMEGFYLLEGHAKFETDVAAVTPDRETEDPRPWSQRRLEMKPLPMDAREVTAILVRTGGVGGLTAIGLQNTINEGNQAMAVTPIREISIFFDTFVTPIQAVLLLITVMICVVSGVSILVSIYNSMSDRRHEIAVMRALGAGRGTVMSVVLLESLILALLGGFAGWIAGHLLIGGLASPIIENRTGVDIGVLDFSPGILLSEAIGISSLFGIREISYEFLLIPGLMLLAIIVGLLPALAAYRTDVSRWLSATP